MTMHSEPSTQALRSDLEQHREELRDAVEELGRVARGHLDPREWYARHPALCLAAAFALGWRIGLGR
jgi:hypothetical protein